MHTLLKRSSLPAALITACFLTAGAFGQTGYSITGGLSNFDCNNHCDDPCDELEIEIEGIHPEDVRGTYRNGNYGSPRILLSSDGTFTIIDYHNPQHLTAVGSIEHFGVSLTQLSSANAIRVRWMRNGAPATVNGSVPLPGGGSAPNTQPMLPSISTDMTLGSSGGDGIGLSVTNNDPQQWIWIKHRAQLIIGSNVSLEALMPNNPLITSSVVIDNSPTLLAPGQTLTIVSDLVEVEDNQSVIFASQYYQDLGVVGPFNNSHSIGPELGNVMTAAIASPGTGCEFSRPVIITQPQSVEANAGRGVDLRVDADGNDLTLSYQWLKDFQPITNNSDYSGATTDGLSIDALSPATEGFYSVRISNTCGTIVSNSALVFITGHNITPAPLSASIDPPTLTVAPFDTIDLTGNCAFVPPGTTYFWKHNGVPITEGDGGASSGGGFVSGASGSADSLPATLSIDGAQLSDSGTYTITFTNPGGTAVSNQATVTVAEPCGLYIDAQPQPNLICLGSTAPFEVAAVGIEPFTYQWQFTEDGAQWINLTESPTAVSCGSASGTAWATPANAPAVDIGVDGCEGYFAVRCIVTDGCGAIDTDPTLILVQACAPCPADFNQDGGVDGSDVADFFTAWGNGDPSGDVNADGGIDGQDVEVFFSYWEQGGC